jgi:hypothetical protein
MKRWLQVYHAKKFLTKSWLFFFPIGVECAKVLLVFLSKTYVESINCQLEFRYAVKRGKAFVIIRTEPNIQMEQWMVEAIQGFPQYDVFSYANLEALVNGVPTVKITVKLNAYFCYTSFLD